MSSRLIPLDSVGAGAGVVRAAEVGAAVRACFLLRRFFVLVWTISGVIL
jgi:hypothetical protein